MKMGDGDENSLLSMTPSQDGTPLPDPLRVDWPKVIEIRNWPGCKDSVCFCITELVHLKRSSLDVMVLKSSLISKHVYLKESDCVSTETCLFKALASFSSAFQWKECAVVRS